MEKYKLEQIKYGVQRLFSDDFIKNTSGVEILKEVSGWRMYVLGRLFVEAAIKTYDVQYPETWWDAFKERFFPAWLEKRFPVKRIKMHISVDVVYPELHKKISLPDEPHFTTLQVYEA